ncbi:DUF4012 domain-containing protein [Patescibacteria group bacterium]|nr:DUF4012 domain-containing protein [Patescibacteria group bacterium]
MEPQKIEQQNSKQGSDNNIIIGSKNSNQEVKESFKLNIDRDKLILALKYFGVFLLTLPILAIMLFASYALDIKQSYQYGISGKNGLETSISLAKKFDFSNAIHQADLASHNFSLAINKVTKIQEGLIASRIPFLDSELQNIENLLLTGEKVSLAISNSSSFSLDLQAILDTETATNLTNLTPNKKADLLEKITKSGGKLKDIELNINEAGNNLNNVKTNGLLWFIKDDVSALKDKLTQGRDVINKIVPLTKIMPTLVGYPQKARYLVLLQNSDRLRPIGGTIGTYAILEFDRGEIISYELYDTNHLDIQSKKVEKIDPPKIIKELTGSDNWLLRDANWSPDWPTSAKNAEQLYKTKLLNITKNNKSDECPISDCSLNFDGVIGLTPELTLDLLSITGPVEVDNVTYTKDNFVRLYEEELDKKYLQAGKYTNQKLLIAEIVKTVQLRLFDLPFSSWPELGMILANNADNKNILVYSKNTDLQDLLSIQNWSGELKKTNGDYLMIVDANIPAQRLNENISETAHYEVEQKGDKLIAKLRVKYVYVKNNDSRNYKNYIRVFTPLGSRIISSSTNLNNIDIENELGKTSFGATLEIKPGTSYEFQISYELPGYIIDVDNKDAYSLYVQKQPGNDIDNLEVFVSLASNIEKTEGDAFYTRNISDTKVDWKTDLQADKLFKAIITK